MPIQKLSPGTLSAAWKRELTRCRSENLLERLWKHDSSLWPAEEHELALIKSNLQWLDLPTQMEPCVNRLIECAKMAERVQVTVRPRYLQALGWSYKEGPPHGIFIVITAEPDEDVAIPGAEYTFADLQLALALAECEALEQAEKHSIRLHLSELSEKSLKQLADVVIQAVAQIRRVKQTKQD